MESKRSYIKRNLKFLWDEYRFLIPPKKLAEYLRLFINRVILNRRPERDFYSLFDVIDYNSWLEENKEEISIKELAYNPLISIIIPVYNVPFKYLKECIDSVLNQSYKNYEICIADDCSTDEELINTLKDYDQNHSNIKVVFRKENGHISEASNSAIEIASGDFIALLDNDDLLTEHALYEVVKVLNENQDLDLIYSDEDKIDLEGRRCDPHFKPDFSPDTFLSHNYICHLAVLRKSLVDRIGGFRKGYEGSQDYDLFLRFTEKTDKIYHIPKILYHWRMIEGSTSMVTSNKSYASDNGIKSLSDALQRRGIKGTITNIHTSYIINYEIIGNPKVSIIIPTKDKIEMLLDCVGSIISGTSYENYEIIIIDNNSEKEKTKIELEKLVKEYEQIRVIEDNSEFNYSRINNKAVKESTGDYILLLNNDIIAITDNWLEIMLGYAQQKHIGAVGAKLLFPDKKIQHAGVIVGVGEEQIANHAYYLKERYDAALAGRLLVPYNYSAVTGACLMVSKEKYNEVAGLSENLVVNYNDIDFCLKLLDKGYYNVFLPQVELYHFESQSRGKKPKTESQIKEFENSRDYMQKTWQKYLDNDKFYNPNLSKKIGFRLDKKEQK